MITRADMASDRGRLFASPTFFRRICYSEAIAERSMTAGDGQVFRRVDRRSGPSTTDRRDADYPSVDQLCFFSESSPNRIFGAFTFWLHHCRVSFLQSHACHLLSTLCSSVLLLPSFAVSSAPRSAASTLLSSTSRSQHASSLHVPLSSVTA